jgi:hypothetical protein
MAFAVLGLQLRQCSIPPDARDAAAVAVARRADIGHRFEIKTFQAANAFHNELTATFTLTVRQHVWCRRALLQR